MYEHADDNQAVHHQPQGVRNNHGSYVVYDSIDQEKYREHNKAKPGHKRHAYNVTVHYFVQLRESTQRINKSGSHNNFVKKSQAFFVREVSMKSRVLS